MRQLNLKGSDGIVFVVLRALKRDGHIGVFFDYGESHHFDPSELPRLRDWCDKAIKERGLDREDGK